VRATRLALGAVTAITVCTAGFVGANSLITVDRPTHPVQSPPSTSDAGEKVDRTALSLIDDLRPMSLCRGYDFYYKEDIAGEPYRPVQCGAEFHLRWSSGEVTEPGQPTQAPPTPLEETRSIVRGPDIMIYAFASRDAKRAWMEANAAPWGGRIAGDEWVIDVITPDAFERVRDALTHRGATVVGSPNETWQVGRHVVERPGPALRPEVPLRRVSRGLQGTPELISAELGLYSDLDDSDRKPVAAWIITYRKCVPAYGGEDASPECRGHELHIVLDARTGKRIATFSS
jgi:hypothetical protein